MSSSSRFAFLLSCTFGFLFAAADVPASAQTLLRWKLEPGEKLKQVVVQDMTMSAKIGPQTIDSKVTQTVDVLWDIKNVDADGVAEVAQQFERVRLKMDAPGGLGFEFDSQSEEKPTGLALLVAPALEALAKAQFVMKMTPRGEIKDVEVIGNVADGLANIPGAGQMLSKENLAAMVKNGLYGFPAEPVAVGASWTTVSDMDVPQLGKMKTTVKLTNAGTEEIDGRSLVKINVEATTSLDGEAPADSPAKVAIKDNQSTGVIYFDNQAGRIDRSEITQKMLMQVTAGGREIEQTLDQKISTTVSPVEAQ